MLCVWHWANIESVWDENYNDVIMGMMASQITSVSNISSTVCSVTDKKKCQSSASLFFVRGIHWWPVNSPHKGPVTLKMFPFDYVTRIHILLGILNAQCHLQKFNPISDKNKIIAITFWIKNYIKVFKINEYHYGKIMIFTNHIYGNLWSA